MAMQKQTRVNKLHSFSHRQPPRRRSLLSPFIDPLLLLVLTSNSPTVLARGTLRRNCSSVRLKSTLHHIRPEPPSHPQRQPYNNNVQYTRLHSPDSRFGCASPNSDTESRWNMDFAKQSGVHRPCASFCLEFRLEVASSHIPFQGFANPANMTFEYPKNTGVSFSLYVSLDKFPHPR